MNLKYFINKSKNEYEIILSGEVGFDIRGKEIANEIRYLNSIGATKITERINSPGGYVWAGYDIIDANINSKAIIETVVTGLAASTAAFIAVTGTKGYRFIVDYGQGMIHDPSLGDDKIESLEEGSDKEGLIKTKNSIATIMSNNSNIKIDKINELMTAETWLNADQWVSMGFADKVIKTTDKPTLKNTYNILEFVNVCKDFHNKNNDNFKIDNKMKTVLNVLNLSEDASEASAVSAVKAITNKAELAEGKVEGLAKDIQNLNVKITGKDEAIAEKDAKIVELEGIVNASKVAAIKNVVDSAITSGKFVEENRVSLTEKATSLGVDNFSEMIDMVKLPQANAVGQIQNNSNNTPKATKNEALAAEFLNLQKTNPAELIKIMNFEPGRFELMEKAYNES